MKSLILSLFLGVIGMLGIVMLGTTLSGCENLYKDTRQTGKNINGLLLNGYQKDIYESN